MAALEAAALEAAKVGAAVEVKGRTPVLAGVV